MQNVVHNTKSDSSRDSELNEVGKEHSGSSSPLSGNLSVDRGQSLTSLQSNFMADLSESDDDDVSEINSYDDLLLPPIFTIPLENDRYNIIKYEVESFILDQNELDEEPVLDTTKFLLADDVSDNGIDAETQCRLEALLEASGIGKISLTDSKQFADPEVLRRLTSSVSCALDEAAAALSRMRAEPHGSSEHAVDGRSLAEACSEGDICTVRRLLEEGRNVNELSDDGECLLSLASAAGYFELVQLLLAMRANVDDRGLKDTTPLMEAASAGHADICRMLLQHGADANAQTSQEGNTPLMFACAGGHEEVVSILLEAGANVEDHNENGHTPLMEAASAGHVGVAKCLVQHGASINTHSNEFKESALTLACYKGHLEMVRFLLEAGADQEHKTDEMHTALMEASMDGHVEVARLLLDSGAQVNMPADSFESPLTLAACGGHVELAMLLLDRGANIEEVNDEGYTPLMEAAREGHEEMVALLLSQVIIKINGTERTTIRVAPQFGTHSFSETITTTTIQDLENSTTLPGADINAQTEETQETALTLACCGGFLEVSDFLIKAGADIELGASTPLMEASQEGHMELVRYLINAGANVNAQTATGDSALTYACENGHTDVADILLQAGAELEHESEGGRTPLMKAARAGHLCTVQFLISKGANVNKQTSNNDHNPLSLACAGGHLPVVELLLAHGADPTHKLKDNSTMLIEASKGGHTAVVQLLLDYPNSLLASPPPPPDLSQISNPGIESNEAPRVPPHGLQVFSPQESEQSSSSSSSYLANVQSVPRIQELLQMRETLPGASPQSVPKQKSLQRKNVLVKNNEAPSFSLCENIQRCHYRNKTNAAAQASSVSIQAETSNQKCLGDDISSSGGGGGGIESVDDKELKPSERLEACINSMMKKAELLHPSPEEQILQKQQILEELQRVERELQEKAQAQLLLTAQHQQHHQHLQGLGTVATATPTIATVTSNTATAFPGSVSGAHAQQLLLNSGTLLDVGSLSSTVVPDLTGHLGLNLRTTAAAAAHLASPGSVQTLQPQAMYQHPKPIQQSMITTTSLTSDHVKPRLCKQATKQTKTVLKQQAQHTQHQQYQQQTQLQNSKISSQSHLEEVDKLNLRNVLTEQQQQQQQLQQQQQHPQQLLQQHPQQQFVLSEFTQNLTLRANSHLSDGAADALALMQAAGGIKFTTDATQTHAIPIFDPVTVGQALLQQQLQQQQLLQQHQQLTQVIQQETKRQQQQMHFDKTPKSLKGKSNKIQHQSLLQATQPQLQSLQVQQSQHAIKQQLSSSCTDACALVGNIPLDATGVLTLGAPAFPVSLAVSPVSLPSQVSIATSCGATFAHNISLEDSLMVAAPPRTLHDTLGDIMTGPTTQLAGNQMAIGQGNAHCVEPTCLGVATSGVGVGLAMTSLPGGNSPSTSLPLTFHTLAPAVTSCVTTQVSTTNDGMVTPHLPHLTHAGTAPSTPAPPPPLYPPIDLNSQTDSNHDTALTLACVGGHEELVSLLLSRGANIEHRDKKGFTPLMLAATAGHSGVVEILLNHASDIEAQSERTKDTALSLACSGGRYEVVDILLARGANKEHRNVSDYTPLSLAASGGYTNIIKLLLSHGAEINSRTGSKLGISPLMLAAMNGHTAAVKLLLDMGSDINAQIETNRNTALTLACFQGRHEVVSLLLDRKANVEHRAKTGLTPLMEAASGGYVEVGRVLLDKGADVNAPPVPSSRDTALTIAADKGHYRFVELLLQRDAVIDAKNKKGNSPLWLSCNGGHLDVVQLLAQSGADIDSQDNRKVSCLMAAFRKGHVKVVKWMVKHVTQFPSDQEMFRFISTLSDKDLVKKCHQCVETIRLAKERQAAEANKYATILLEELDQERSRAENRKLAAARRRERKRKKKKEKQEQLRAAKAAAEENKKSEKSHDDHLLSIHVANLQQSSQSEGDDDDEEDDDEEEEDDKDEKDDNDKLTKVSFNSITNSRLNPESFSPSKNKSKSLGDMCSDSIKGKNKDNCVVRECETNYIFEAKKSNESRVERRRESERSKTQEKNKKNMLCKSGNIERDKFQKDSSNEKHPNKILESNSNLYVVSSRRNSKKRNQKQEASALVCSTNLPVSTSTSNMTKCTPTILASTNSSNSTDIKCHGNVHKLHKHQKEVLVNGMSMGEYDELCALFSAASVRGKTMKSTPDPKLALETLGELALDLPTEMALSASLRSPSTPVLAHNLKSPLANSTSPKKFQKRDEGWKEVVRRSKKVSVPSNAISRVIGRGGCNINAIRESSGAHIEVEKQKGQGERTVIIRGSAESTRLAQQLITALIKEPDKELSEILIRCGLNRTTSLVSTSNSESSRISSGGCLNSVLSTTTAQAILNSNQNKGTSKQPPSTKSSGIVASVITKSSTIPPPSLPASAAPPFTNQIRSTVTSTQNIRPGIPVCTVGTPPFLSNSQNAWTGVLVSGKVPATLVPRQSVPLSNTSNTLSLTAVSTRVIATSSVDKGPNMRQLFPPESKTTTGQQSTTTSTKTTVSYTMAVISQGKTPKTVPANIVTVTTRVTTTSDTKVSTIAPVERAGSAPPVPVPSMINNSQVPIGQNVSSGPSSVQPFSMNQSSKVGNGPPSGSPISRPHGTQTPTQNKPFTSTVSSSNTVPTSSTTVPPPCTNTSSTVQSTIAQEYSPFNNLFSKVAQPSVWGQKDKEASKPNFASVAAAGITSVASQIQNSNPVQSALMLSLPQSSEHEMVVDAAKAPGYRGNLHISPSASSTSSVTSNASQHQMQHNNNFGPIGSGPRSAPCTPPLGPIGPPSSAGTTTRRSTPPAVPSPPPTLHSRSLPDSHSSVLNDMPRSMTSQMAPQHLPSQMSEAIYHHQGLGISSHPNRHPSYPLTSTFAGPAGTSTTFSQHSPLSSVGTIAPEGTSNGNMAVVQSNLNPNAPDFSSRASLLMTQHGPPMHHLAPRLPPGPNNFPENSVPPAIAQFRPMMPNPAAINHNFSLHAMANPHAQAMNRFPFHHAAHGHPQQAGDFNPTATAGPVGTLPAGMGTLSQGAEGVPMLNMIGGYPTQGMSQVMPGSANIPHHYPGMQSMMGIRPSQRSSSTTPSVGTSSKDEGSPMATMSPNSSPQGSNLPSPTGVNVQENPNPAGTIGEDRKLPRPIGMERAQQRKNPMYGGGVPDINNIWAFGSSNRSDMPNSTDWIPNMQAGMSTIPPMPQDESVPSIMHNNYGGNRFTDMMASDGNHPLEHSYQAVAGGNGCYPFVNGVPPHMLAPQLYPSASNPPGQIDTPVEMWGVHPKIPLSSGGDGLPQAFEQKMTWHRWSPHQA